MSYFQLNDPNNPIDKTSKLVYNYFSTAINKSEIQENTNYDGNAQYLSIPFINGTSTNNLYYTNTKNQQFSTTKIYLYGLLHNNISGITTQSSNTTGIIGEIVIEHKGLNGTAYVCFFVKAPDNEENPPTNDIDNIYYLLNNAGSVSESIILNNIISTQNECFVYKDSKHAGNTVFIFTTPIVVNANTAEIMKSYIKTTTLFDVNPTNYTIIPAGGISRFQEDQIYIDCSPTGASQEEINTYNVPINSELMHEKQDMDYMKTSVNFFVFLVGLVVCYFAVPQLYKLLVVEKTILFKSLYPNAIPTPELERIRSIDVFILCSFITLASLSFYYGYAYNNYNLITAGLFSAIFYGLSFSIIQNNKIMDSFMSGKDKDGKKLELKYIVNAEGVSNAKFNAGDFGAFIMQALKFLVYPDGKNASERISSFPAVYVGVSICYAIILAFIYLTTKFNYLNALLMGIGLVIPPFVLIATLINM